MTGMKKTTLACLLLACAACNNQPGQQAPIAGDAAVPAPQPQPDVVAAPVQPRVARDQAVYSRLPDSSLEFDFEVRLKSDKQSTTASGQIRRGLALQYSGISTAELWPRLDHAFSLAGYVAKGDRPADGAAMTKRTYAKPGAPALTVSIPASQEDLAGSGVFWLGWDI